MHVLLPPWLALSAALLPTASAFYPYHYGDDSTTSRSRRTIAPASDQAAQSNSITLPLRRIPTPKLRTRQNAYDIVNSVDPKQANSVAIDQDGGDLSYMVAVTIGDSKEEYHLLLDSAASNTWVMGQDCGSEACKTHNTFGKGDSSTLKTQNTPFSVTYGTGSVSGTLASDTLHIGPLSPALTFGLATTVSQEFSSYPMDGILGIGRGAKAEGSINAPQVMDVLSNNRLIGAKLYGIHLSRGSSKVNDGELNIGEVNKDRFSGDLNWSDVVDNDTGFWEIKVENAGVDGKTLGIAGRTAIIDTGTSFILMPEQDAVKIHQQVQGYKQDGETFSVPCDTASVVQFVFNKQSYNISTADWRGDKLSSGLCRSNIIGRQTFKDTQWLVGDVFLKNVYSVFDFDKKRVGLGVKSANGATGSSSTGASSTASPGSSSGTPRTDSTSATAASARASTTASANANANPTPAAESQPQGQSGSQNGSAGRHAASLTALLAACFISMLI
ncbi:aspartic peptidase domain-containing protein [Paraphoma chrysanthemicola]|nr:aspartic peptidase domain-containing protein [Paraphoma chrysanthemicola]